MSAANLTNTSKTRGVFDLLNINVEGEKIFDLLVECKYNIYITVKEGNMFELNKELMFENIYYLLEKTDKKIGEFETAAGVSPGYISRTLKDEKSKPGIEFIFNAARELGLSVDTLVSVRFSELTPTEKYLMQFIDKLKKDTASDKLAWDRETENELNYMDPDMNGYVDHSLFSLETFYEKGETDYPDEVTRVVMVSDTFGANTYIDGDCFNLKMKNGAILYLMKISKSAYSVKDAEVRAKEIWIHLPGSAPKFLCSTAKKSPFKEMVEDLYFVVSEFAKHPKIAEDIREVIDAYMLHDDLSTDVSAIFDL